jgi:transmembrane sensor
MPGFNSRKDIQKMIEKYVEGTATAEEAAFVESYYAYQEQNEVPELSIPDQESLGIETFENITHQLNAAPKNGTRTVAFLRVASIAAVLLIATLLQLTFFLRKNLATKKPGKLRVINQLI